MSGPLDALLSKYKPKSPQDLENALKEIIQEITLAALARANFFDKAAFYGGTALRIFHGLPRFSEDLDFTLLSPQNDFSLKTYFKSVTSTLNSFGLDVEINSANKKLVSDIESAFLKTNTKILFLKVAAGKIFYDKIYDNKKINIKFEVDTTPPLDFETEIKTLPPPITASIKILKPSSLFAGKMNAVLFRKWNKRIKGRDFYDLLWYIGQDIPVNLTYLESKMKDSNHWSLTKKLQHEDLVNLLESRIKNIDFKNASQDLISFINDPIELKEWNKEFFLTAIKKLRTEN